MHRRPSARCSATRTSLRNSATRSARLCMRPAVSTSSSSVPRARALVMASNTTAAASAPPLLANHRHTEPFAVAHQLIDGGGAERVGGGQHHRVRTPVAMGQLGERRGLADAVDAQHQHHGQLAAARHHHRRGDGILQDLLQGGPAAAASRAGARSALRRRPRRPGAGRSRPPGGYPPAHRSRPPASPPRARTKCADDHRTCPIRSRPASARAPGRRHPDSRPATPRRVPPARRSPPWRRCRRRTADGVRRRRRHPAPHCRRPRTAPAARPATAGRFPSDRRIDCAISSCRTARSYPAASSSTWMGPAAPARTTTAASW